MIYPLLPLICPTKGVHKEPGQKTPRNKKLKKLHVTVFTINMVFTETLFLTRLISTMFD